LPGSTRQSRDPRDKPGDDEENLLEALYISISAGGPWRITFEFRDGHAWDVEIVDYH
jgi:plasmid maintenance system killer protein